MYDFLIIGASGMQGKIVSRDLVENGHAVFLTDVRKDLQKNVKKSDKIKFEYLDARDRKKLRELIREHKIKVVINCAEGDWNLIVYEICLEVGAHVIDLGSEIAMTKDQFSLGKEFADAGLTAITGCGSTPGINNIMLNYASDSFDEIHTIEAGFVWDSNIKTFVPPFSIESILEELTDPAPVIIDGKWRLKIPMLNIETREFKSIGSQKIFPVRHPETYTFNVYYYKSGLKNMTFFAGFPDHSLHMLKTFIEMGFAKKIEVDINGQSIAPINMLTECLRKTNYPEGYLEKENLWVNIIGHKNGEKKKIAMECIVDTLAGWEDAGCNIDTGMPASIIAQMILTGAINRRGSFAPGLVVPKKIFFEELRKRKMSVYENDVLIN